MASPGTAAVLSGVPGVGRIYNGASWRGASWRGASWRGVTPGVWTGSGGRLGWVAHRVSAWTAYRFAERTAGGAV